VLRPTSRRLWLAAFVAVLVAVPAALAGNWPRWRGPTADGISPETNVPAEWDATKNVVWKLKMPGASGATPIVWGDRIFLMSEDGKDVVLLCVSTDGKELWKRKLGAGGRRYRADEGNDASPSPSTDGKHVYTYTGAGDLSCHDFEGKEVWAFNMQERYGKFRIMHGMHVTPLLDGDRLYLSFIHSGVPAEAVPIVALDKATGKEVWKTTRSSDGYGENKEAYASPQIWRRGNEAYLVIHGNDYTTAHSLTDGKELWRLGDLNPRNGYDPTLRFVSTPLVTPDLIVVPTAKRGPTVAVKPEARGKITAGSAGEQWRLPRNTPDVPSPLLHDGLVYLCRESGVLYCLDAKTGQVKYEQAHHKARYRASPVYADGKLFLTSRDGVVSVVKAGPKYELLAVNRLPDQIAASPVIVDGRIYLRGFETLYAIGKAGK
jgi:outer membrane protein assembly factor BamB